jgi:hypothetical protein
MGKAMTAVGACWLIIVQWLSSGLGGYLTGRLRVKWVSAHTHEVFFRDTAHGFLAWALASIAGAALVMTVLAHLGSGPMHHGPQAAGAGAAGSPVESYYIDALFRSTDANAGVTDHDRMEATRILERGVARGNIPESDRNYLTALVAARTGIAPAEADLRVSSVITEEKTALDATRKAAAEASLMLCFALLVGAFIACVAGALGGHHGDLHYATGSLRVER